MTGLHLNARAAAVLVVVTVALSGSCNCRYTLQATGSQRKVTATPDDTFSVTVNGTTYPAADGRCAMCSPTYSKCPEGLPVCVDTSSGGTIKLPCDILPLPATSAPTLLTGTTTRESQSDELGDAEPSWEQYLDNGTNHQTSGGVKDAHPVLGTNNRQPIRAPSATFMAAEVFMAQCPPQKPSKMCCQVKVLGGKETLIGHAAPASSNGAGRQQAALLWVFVSQLAVLLGLLLSMSC